MTEKAIEEIVPALNSLERFFSLRRKKDRQFISDRLAKFNAEVSVLRQKLHEQECRSKALDEELAREFAQNDQLNKKIENLQQDLAAQRKLEASLRTELATLTTERDETLHDLMEKDEVLSHREAELTEQVDHNKELAEKYDGLEQEHKNRKAELEHIHREHTDLSERFGLINSILAAKPKSSDAVDDFKLLFRDEFLKFANWESSLANEAEAIILMQEVMENLALIVAFPHLFTKTLGAIGGGFSSGKSAFLNSFFRDKEVELPVGINPVTSLPCYVVASQDCHIHGHASNGGVLPIAPETFKLFSPGFLTSFSFNLKEIMPAISVGASLDPEYFDNICLIDTPGYNPSDPDGSRDKDRDSAMEQLKKARFIVWMIGLDSHGTVPKTDIDFLNNQDLEGKQLYVVLNKADLKPPSEINEIMDEVENSLEEWDIPYDGISAYSANEGREYNYDRLPLLDFLTSHNKREETVRILKEKVQSVFAMYIHAIEREKKEQKKRHGDLHSLKLDILELGVEDTNSKAHSRIAAMQSTHTTAELEKQLKKAKELQVEFINILDKFETELPR